MPDPLIFFNYDADDFMFNFLNDGDLIFKDKTNWFVTDVPMEY